MMKESQIHFASFALEVLYLFFFLVTPNDERTPNYKCWPNDILKQE